MERVEVVWADAHAADIDTWTPLDDLLGAEAGEEYLVVSVGWLVVGSKPKHVTICQSHTADDHVDHVLHIPEGMVRRITTLHPLTSVVD